MANLPYKDIDGTTTKYVKATGVGSDADPFVTIRAGTTADGSDVTQGAIADAAATTDGGSFSVVALIKRLLGKFPGSLGQKTSAASLGVVLASDQSAVPVAGTFFQATQPVSSAALPLPAGAATSANQATTNVSVASLDTKAPALGQALVGASVPVVLPATQITALTPPAAITGFATAANQTTTNVSLASVDTKTPALGQALAAASSPVVLPAAQITTLTPPAAITGFATATNQTATNVSLASLDTKLPASIGTKTSAASLGVVLASDQATLNVNLAPRLDATTDAINIGAVGGTLPDSTAVILASAARTATTSSATITKPQLARGAIFLINTTAGVNATDTIQFTLEVQDPIGLSWRGIWTSAAVINFNGLTGYSVYPGGAAGSFSAFVAIPLPTTYRVRVVHATAASVTYSVSAVYCS